MNSLDDVIHLGPEDEARRLWAGAREAHDRAGHDLVALCESLDLGLRAAEILAIRLLEPVKDEFPATIGLLLDTPDPAVDTYRDAITVPRTLQFTDLLDLLGEAELECVSPGLHRGWEDRRFSCRRSRATAQEAIGITLTRDERDRLLLLSAYRNRIFRHPPPVRVVPADILAAFAPLERLVEGLMEAPEQTRA